MVLFQLTVDIILPPSLKYHFATCEIVFSSQWKTYLSLQQAVRLISPRGNESESLINEILAVYVLMTKQFFWAWLNLGFYELVRILMYVHLSWICLENHQSCSALLNF